METDERILELQAEIDGKRRALGSPKKFSPVTHCSLALDGQTYNLHTLNAETLIHILAKLTAFRYGASQEGLVYKYTLSGFNINNWITDIKAKLANIEHAQELAKLRELEEKLNQLLSHEKRTELEINAIADMLK